MFYALLKMGLESLIPNKNKAVVDEHQVTASKKESIFWIEVDKIKPNPYQPRAEIMPDSLKDLASSIREHGILQPLLVTKIEKEIPSGTEISYYLIAGERRLQAAKIAGLPQVPVIIREATDQERLELSIIENLQREDLNPLEKARAFKRLQHEFGLTQKDLAQKIGKSREAVANLLRLLELPEPIQEGLEAGKISEGHARAILGAKERETQLAIFKEILNRGLNVRGVEEKARLIKQKSFAQTAAFTKDFSDILGKIKKLSGFEEIKLQETKNGLQLILNFHSLPELKKIVFKIFK